MREQQIPSFWSLWSPFHQYTDTFLNNPWTNWQRFFNPMTTLERTVNTQFFPQNYTINWKNAEDVEVEKHVISEVGSYGKQLSIILDVLDVLVARLDKTDMTPQERRFVERFYDLTQEVESAVADMRGPKNRGFTQTDLDSLIDDLQALKRSDPTAYDRQVRRLLETLTPAQPATDGQKP